jgi:hypothetical protein
MRLTANAANPLCIRDDENRFLFLSRRYAAGRCK